MTRRSSARPRAIPRKRPVQDRSRETVRAILEAAARIFEERGIAAATTDAPIESEQLRALVAMHRDNCEHLARWIASRSELRVADPALAARVGFDALTALAHGFALDRHVGSVERREEELVCLLRRYWTGAP